MRSGYIFPPQSFGNCRSLRQWTNTLGSESSIIRRPFSTVSKLSSSGPFHFGAFFFVSFSVLLCFSEIFAISVVKRFEVNSIFDLCLRRTILCWHSSSLRDLVLTSRCRKDSSSHDAMFECGIGKSVVVHWLLWMFEMVSLQLVMCAFQGSFHRKHIYPSRK